jgi:hypothetical protein
VGKSQVHGERDKVLLSAVMDVSLQPSPFGVLRIDESLPGHPQFLRQGGQLGEPMHEFRPQPRASQYETGLIGEACEEPFLDRSERHVLVFLYGKDTE